MKIWRASNNDGLGFAIIFVMLLVSTIIVIHGIWLAYNKKMKVKVLNDKTRKEKAEKSVLKTWKKRTVAKKASNFSSTISSVNELNEMK